MAGDLSQPERNAQDGAAVRAALAGDRDAFGRLYAWYFPRVYDFLARMMRDPTDAADVTQETFIHALTALPSLNKPEGFKAWLFTIARNQALNRLERNKRLAPMPTRITEDGDVLALDRPDARRDADPEAPVLDAELASLVWEAARGLDEKSYAILDLHVRQGLDSGELADALGVTKGNAYTRLSRVKDRFEESLAALIVARRGRAACATLQEMMARVTQYTAAVRQQVSKHIRQCATCSETRRNCLVSFEALAALAAPPPPSGLLERIAGALDTHEPVAVAPVGWWRGRRRVAGAVAALLLLCFGALLSARSIRDNGPAPPPTAPLTATATASVTATAAPATDTPAPTPPRATPTPLAAFPVVLPATPIPPTQTPAPPTETPIPPTERPVPLTPVPAPTAVPLMEPPMAAPLPAMDTPTPATPTPVPMPPVDDPTEIPPPPILMPIPTAAPLPPLPTPAIAPTDTSTPMPVALPSPQGVAPTPVVAPIPPVATTPAPMPSVAASVPPPAPPVAPNTVPPVTQPAAITPTPRIQIVTATPTPRRTVPTTPVPPIVATTAVPTRFVATTAVPPRTAPTTAVPRPTACPPALVCMRP